MTRPRRFRMQHPCPCRKVRHATAEAALVHLTGVERYNARRGRTRPGRLHVYLCPRCAGWHVGHAPLALPPSSREGNES
jgi:hypothetical protein